tara:strand:+ start:1244 stop:1726 length:483 start_codon:yes stop_codon:yes gene_type:complete
MAEIFVINKSASLDGVLVSDLPVVTAAPVARQIQWYLPSLYTAYEAEITEYLAVAAGTAVVGDITGAVAAGTALDAVSIGKTYGTGSVEDVLRILMGANSSAGMVEESANLGNHKILGGTTRRIYDSASMSASIHEGFLRAQLDASDIIIYNADGSVAHS